MIYVFGAIVALVCVYVFSPMLYKKLCVKASVFSGKVEDLLDNPVEEAQYDIKVAEQEISAAKLKLSDLLVANKMLEREKITKCDEVDKYTRLASQAADKKNESDVRNFVAKKITASRRVSQIDLDTESNENITQKMRETIIAHEQRIEDAKNKTGELSARYENAKLRDKFVNTEFSDVGLKNLDSFEEKVAKFEAKVEAKTEVFTSNESKYDVSDIEDEVSKLMNRNN